MPKLAGTEKEGYPLMDEKNLSKKGKIYDCEKLKNWKCGNA
jgi:hypothetical protein